MPRDAPVMIAVLDMDSASPIRFLSRVSLLVRISFSVSGATTSSFAAAPVYKLLL